MQFIKTNFNADPNIGLYGFATDSYCLLGMEPKHLVKMKDALGVDIRITPVAETRFVGIFAAGNKNGLLLPKIIEDYELKKLKQFFGINIQVIESKTTALGNLVLCNDKGCLISSHLKKFKMQIQDCLGVEVQIGKIANTEIIGSAGRATNKGCLVHREASEEEIKFVENLLKVKVDVGTINFGTPFIKAGIIVNSKGMVVSDNSTGPELDRCFEVFE
jgi:translation initiation factor 6